MNRPHLLTIIGTRPEAIKMAPVILEIQRASDRFHHMLVSTAQHREMLDQVLTVFGITPDVDLGLMQPNQSLADLTARALTTLTKVFVEHRPTLVLLQGDTTTVMAAALAAFYQRIPVGHVEAGLRTFDRQNPFPEEINRRIASVLSDLHFAPTERARGNLLAEGVPAESVFVTGNTIVDALREMPLTDPFASESLRQLPLAGRRLIVVTAHRRENHGDPLRNICRALRMLAEKFSDVTIVYPVHLNPNVRQVVQADLGGAPAIHLIDPLPYPDLLRLLARSELILTDSGGIQEEAPSLHKPVLVLRETTERPEVIEVGAGQLVGTDTDRIVTAASRLLTDRAAYEQMINVVNPFGDGRAAARIVQILTDRYSGSVPA